MSINKNIPSLIGSIAILMLSACGGGGGGATTAPPPVQNTNTAPTISGTPNTSVLAGVSYAFSPSAQDADGDSLSFSAQNLPDWMTIDADTGTISGIADDPDDTTYDITISVSDGSASAALPTFTLEVMATYPVTLNGIATDNPLANAEVYLNVAGFGYQTTTDQNGAYSLDLLILKNAASLQTPLELRVTGTDNQASAQLVSWLPGIDQLLTLASGDDTIDLSELDELRVTHITTARYLLLKALFKGAEPANYDQILAAYSQLDNEQQERIQSAIKLFLDNPTYDPGEQNVMDLLSAGSEGPEAAFKAWLANQSLLNGDGSYPQQVLDDLAIALAETRADSAQSLAFTTDDVIGDLWLHEPPHPDLTPMIGELLRIKQGGNASVSYFQSSYTPLASQMNNATWALVDGKLVVSGDANTSVSNISLPRVEGTAQEYAETAGIHLEFAQHLIDNHLGQQSIPVNKRLIETSIELQSRNSNGLWIKQTSNFEYNLTDQQAQQYNWPKEAVSGSFTETRHVRMVNTDALAPTNWSTVLSAGDSWVMPFEGELVGTSSGSTYNTSYDEHFTFFENGTALARHQNKIVDWQINNEVLTLSDDVANREYRIISAKGELFTLRVNAQRADQTEYAGAGIAARDQNHDAAFQAVASSAQPNYWQTGYVLFEAKRLNADMSVNIDTFFGWTLLENGELKIGSPDTYRNNCIDTNKDCVVRTSNRSWSIEGNILTLTYHYGPSQLVRPWEVMSHTEDYTILYEHSLFYEDGAEHGYFLMEPRLNPIYRTQYDSDIWANTQK